LALGVSVFLLAMLVPGCGGASDGGAEGASGQGEPEVRDIAFGVIPTLDYAPVYLAIQEGYFEQEGLRVEPRINQGGAAAVAGLVGGDFQVAGVNWFAFALALDEGIQMDVVAEADRGVPGYTEVIALAGSGIEEPEDLVGRRVTTPVLNGACDLPIKKVLKEEGVDPAAVEFVEIPFPDMPAALERGTVDAICVPEPILTITEQRLKTRAVLDVFSGPTDNFPVIGYMSSTRFAEENPNTVAALRRALEKASRLAQENPDKVREVLPTYTEITPELAGRLTLPEYAATTDQEQLERVTALMKEFGVVEEDFETPEAAGSS
jgi:NitT/TauT family transport system substrate-binding protein